MKQIQGMKALRLVAFLLILSSWPMFLLGWWAGSAILCVGSFVAWGAGLLGYAVARVGGNVKK